MRGISTIAKRRRDPPTPAPPFDASTLTALQQAALLSMYDDSHVRRLVVSRLMAESQDRYSIADVVALRDLNLCERPDGYRMHVLTARGIIAAKELLQTFCLLNGVHVLQGGNDSTGGFTTYRCSCGTWSSPVERSIYSHANIQGSFSRHLREAKSKQTMEIIRTALKPVPRMESA